MDRPWHYGKAVDDGKLRFGSVTQISMADPEDSGCLRKWHYDKVMGKKRPSTRATIRGDSLHAEVERFEKTGDRSLSSLALSGMHFIPEPGPDLRVEHDIVLRPGQPEPGDEVAGALALARAPMDVGGVPLVGRMDLHHFRGTNKGCTSVEDQIDPPGTIEIYDWKSTGDPKWIKRQADLPRTLQLAAYGEWAFRVYPEVKQARLSLGYFVERGGPSRKVTLRVLREDLQPTLEHAAAVVRSVQHAAAEADPDRVEANTRACGAYGGCHHREYCKARMHMALESFVGRTAADRILGKQGDEVGVIDNLKAKAAQQQSQPLPGSIPSSIASLMPGPMPPLTTPASGFGGMVQPKPAPIGLPVATLPLAPLPTIPPAPAGPTPEELAREAARLKAEEEAARAVTLVRSAVEKFEAYSASNPVLGQQMGQYAGHPLGTPAWGGAAAGLYAKARGLTDGAHVYAGTGALGATTTLSSADEVDQLLSQLADFAKQGVIAAAGAAPQVTTAVPPSAQVPATVTVPTTVVANIPPVATAAASPTGGHDPAGAAVGSKADEKAAAPKAAKKKKAGPGADAIVLYVDVNLEGIDAEPLQPLVDKWRADIAAQFAAPGHPTNDIMYQPKDSPLAYGGWKGAIRDCALRAEIPPGAYYLRAKTSDVNEIVVEAMGARARATGGAVIRGL